MTIISVHPVSLGILWKSNESTSKRFEHTRPSKISPAQHSLRASPSSVVTSGSRKSRYDPISMSLQLQEPARSDQTGPPSELNPPTVLSITIPPETLANFQADYEKVSATWPEDLATTKDHYKIEEFVISAHALARRWLPTEVVSRLERYIHDPNQPPAIVIRGLPIDKDLPPTEADSHIKKTGKCMSETWLIGIARIVGQMFMYDYSQGSRTGMGLLVREIYSTPDKVEQVSAQGSRQPLDFHVDFFLVRPVFFPNVIAFMGIRGDRNKEGKTLLCDNRKLYSLLDPSDIHILRSQKITWTGGNGFSKHVIEGSESNPRFNIFEENLVGMGGFDSTVQGSTEAVAAYKRVKDIAATLAEGVWLDSGDLLLVNQTKACHGRSPYQAKYDGNDRWLQRTYINSGGFWEANLVQWPSRTLPFALAVVATN